ncbi:MAG TPA: type II toxin-antitoxin system VapC family toxin [Candidatus Acidoferrum sp.]
MRLLLDTVTFLWSLETPDRISGPAMSALTNPKAVREISVISFSEIAIKQALGKLTFSKTDLANGVTDLQLRVLPYTTEHAYRLFGLPLHHADPFDRQIIAQALAEDIAVVTSDRAFRLYEGLRVIW